MKNRLYLILVVLLSCMLVMFTDADDTDTADVNYHVDSSYSWEIHTNIDFGSNAGINQTVARTAQLSDTTQTGVRVNSNVIPDGTTLKISIDDNQTFTIVNGNTSLNYTVAKTSGGAAMTAGTEVLSIAAGTNTGNQPLYFVLSTSTGAAEVAGTYSGTITYVAEIARPVQMATLTYRLESGGSRTITKSFQYPVGNDVTLLSQMFSGVSSIEGMDPTYAVSVYDANTNDLIISTDYEGLFHLVSRTANIESWSDGVDSYLPNSTYTLLDDVVLDGIPTGNDDASGEIGLELLIQLEPDYPFKTYMEENNITYLTDAAGNVYNLDENYIVINFSLDTEEARFIGADYYNPDLFTTHVLYAHYD